MPKSILVAEDSEIVRQIMRSVLEKAGYSVCGEAADGLEAIQKTIELRPDLIVLDLAMPQMSGVEAASVITGILPKVPIILFTMYDVGPSLTSSAGITLVVSKPDGMTKLVEGVRSVLGSPLSESPSRQRESESSYAEYRPLADPNNPSS